MNVLDGVVLGFCSAEILSIFLSTKSATKPRIEDLHDSQDPYDL